VTHRLTDLSLVTPWGTLTGATTLGGDAPFALAGELAFCRYRLHWPVPCSAARWPTA
jgi:hypothetical protein